MFKTCKDQFTIIGVIAITLLIGAVPAVWLVAWLAGRFS